jgi:hypothetical protein
VRNPKEYRHKKPSKVHLKIRLVFRGKKEPSEDEAVAAMEFTISHGRPPEGWKFYGVDWKHPTSHGSGDVGDLQGFVNLIEHMADVDELQFAFTRVE